jgi:hypothetical protein
MVLDRSCWGWMLGERMQTQTVYGPVSVAVVLQEG